MLPATNANRECCFSIYQRDKKYFELAQCLINKVKVAYRSLDTPSNLCDLSCSLFLENLFPVFCYLNSFLTNVPLQLPETIRKVRFSGNFKGYQNIAFLRNGPTTF